jgi:malate synthase
MEEAALWNAVLGDIETTLGLPHGHEGDRADRDPAGGVRDGRDPARAADRIVGLNCGRWDYIFSYIKTLRRHRDRVLPERGQVTMVQPFLRAYSELLIKTCHRRGAHAMGGMAAQIPISGDDAANGAAGPRARRQAARSHRRPRRHLGRASGADPAGPRGVRRAHAEANQVHIARDDVHAERDDLLRPSLGTITKAGFEGNVEVCVRYLAAWLDGNGCVPIHWLMEDAATAEIARAQLWQWLHFADDGHEPLHLDDGTPVDFALLERALIGLPSKFVDQLRMPGASRINEAIGMLDRLTHADELADFLTLPAYERID